MKNEKIEKRPKNYVTEYEAAVQWFSDAYVDDMLNYDIWRSYFLKADKFFDKKYSDINEKRPKIKNIKGLKALAKLIKIKFPMPFAIIIIGDSCCGKSTVAHKIVDSIKNAEYLSLEHEWLLIYKQQLDEDIMKIRTGAEVKKEGLFNFSKKLDSFARHSKNIVIDGTYVDPKSRGAVLNVLKSKGYKNFVAVNCLNVPSELRRKMIELAAAYEFFSEDMSIEDEIAQKEANYRAETRVKIKEDVLENLKKNIDYVLEIDQIEETIRDENDLFLVDIQTKYNLFSLGFNYQLEWEWDRK